MAEEEAFLEGRLQEEERLRQEAENRRRMDQRIELIRQIADLEKARDQGVNRLRRLIGRDITIFNFSTIEEHYRNVIDVNTDLIARILEWEDLLEVDEEGSTVYPDRGRPEFRYGPQGEDFKGKTKAMELVSLQAIEALKGFFISLPTNERSTVSQLAQSVFLRNPAQWIPQADNVNRNNGQEEDVNVTGEQQTEGEQREDTAGSANTPQGSPRNSIQSSKSVIICGKNYQARKARITRLVENIESDPEAVHSENLEKQANLIGSLLKELNVPGIIDLAATEPDFLEIFGETEDAVNDWSEEIWNKVQDFSLRAAAEVSERKAATQTGFKKLTLPSFNGNILNYMEFKRRWRLEVVPERRPVAMELAALREVLPSSAKAKIIAVTTMLEA